MSQELLYTSAPRGLKPGSRGFCTVLSTQGMAAPLATALEGLSAYRPIYPAGSDLAHRNPIVYSHLKVHAAGRTYDVLSRIADFGLDYSQRANKLAHHVVLDPQELPSGGPARLLTQPGFMRETWEGDPKVVALKPIPGDTAPAGGVCVAWQRETGDAGWAGVVAESFLRNPERLVILLYSPGQNLLPLFAEALSLIPAERRWDVTFSTYFTGQAQGTTCAWRALVHDSKEAHDSLRFVNALRLDLTSGPLGRATGGSLVETARRGMTSQTVMLGLGPTDDFADDDIVELEAVPTEPDAPVEFGIDEEEEFDQVSREIPIPSMPRLPPRLAASRALHFERETPHAPLGGIANEVVAGELKNGGSRRGLWMAASLIGFMVTSALGIYVGMRHFNGIRSIPVDVTADKRKVDKVVLNDRAAVHKPSNSEKVPEVVPQMSSEPEKHVSDDRNKSTVVDRSSNNAESEDKTDRDQGPVNKSPPAATVGQTPAEQMAQNTPVQDASVRTEPTMNIETFVTLDRDGKAELATFNTSQWPANNPTYDALFNLAEKWDKEQVAFRAKFIRTPPTNILLVPSWLNWGAKRPDKKPDNSMTLLQIFNRDHRDTPLASINLISHTNGEPEYRLKRTGSDLGKNFVWCAIEVRATEPPMQPIKRVFFNVPKKMPLPGPSLKTSPQIWCTSLPFENVPLSKLRIDEMVVTVGKRHFATKFDKWGEASQDKPAHTTLVINDLVSHVNEQSATNLGGTPPRLIIEIYGEGGLLCLKAKLQGVFGQEGLIGDIGSKLESERKSLAKSVSAMPGELLTKIASVRDHLFDSTLDSDAIPSLIRSVETFRKDMLPNLRATAKDDKDTLESLEQLERDLKTLPNKMKSLREQHDKFTMMAKECDDIRIGSAKVSYELFADTDKERVAPIAKAYILNFDDAKTDATAPSAGGKP